MRFLTSILIAAIAWPVMALEMVREVPVAKQTLLKTGFEDGEYVPEAEGFSVTEDGAHSGKRCLTAAVDGPDQFRMLFIPFQSTYGRFQEISFWIRSDNGSAGAIALTPQGDAGGGKRVAEMASIPTRWTQITLGVKPFLGGRVALQIAAPASIGRPAGRVWIDDMVICDMATVPVEREGVEDFPAMVCDVLGTPIIAVKNFDEQNLSMQVGVFGERGFNVVGHLAPEGATSIGRPALSARVFGCMAAAAVEKDKRWSIAYARVGSSEPEWHYIAADGPVNIQPALATHLKDTWLVWESNAGPHRGIYASKITEDGAEPPQRISSLKHVSRAPAVVALEDGRFFAAWDSVRDNNRDIYGAWCVDGVWKKEKRITTSPFMESHTTLAAHNGEVWLAYQAEAFYDHRLNAPSEQRIAVAKLEADGLLSMPVGLFDQISPTWLLFKRPFIQFDPEGRLWLTARASVGVHAGWRPMVAVYTGDTWTGPTALWPSEGRWRPVPLAWALKTGLAAIQRDDTPHINLGEADRKEMDIHWKSEVTVRFLPEMDLPEPAPLKTVSMVMPETTFKLADRIEQGAATFARTKQKHNGQTLNLYYGDLHSHTDISACQRSGNPTAYDLYANHRDIDGLDFTAVTDHGWSTNTYFWNRIGEEARASHDPGRFVTFLAEEWTSNSTEYDPPREYLRYGHHNVIFLDPYFDQFFNAYLGHPSPRDLWDELEGVEQITIPHQLADHGTNHPTDWSFVDEKLQPLAEIYQARESYEYRGCPREAKDTVLGHFMQDAWAMQNVIGVIASGDHGGGHGKAGVWATDLSREALFEAFRARHTFGMSDPKMSLFVTSGDAMMGDKVVRKDNAPIPFQIEVKTPRPIKELVIWRNNEIVYRIEPGVTELAVDWVDEAPLNAPFVWYYVRVHCTDDELAWSSPIWFIRK